MSLRFHRLVPLLKLYILNRDELFFGLYPVVRRQLKLNDSAHEIYDLMGKDATLFHHTTNDDSASAGSLYVEQMAGWFDTIWTHRRQAGDSVTRSDGDELATLLARTRHLLLDFDGPVCAVFAGRGARDVSIELLDVLSSDHVQVPADVASASDPFDVLRYAATVGPDLAERIEQRLRAAELEAIRTATPTPHTIDVITAWRQAGRTVAAVSNNSAAAVQTYLTTHGIQVDGIAARSSAGSQHS